MLGLLSIAIRVILLINIHFIHGVLGQDKPSKTSEDGKMIQNVNLPTFAETSKVEDSSERSTISLNKSKPEDLEDFKIKGPGPVTKGVLEAQEDLQENGSRPSDKSTSQGMDEETGAKTKELDDEVPLGSEGASASDLVDQPIDSFTPNIISSTSSGSKPEINTKNMDITSLLKEIDQLTTILLKLTSSSGSRFYSSLEGHGGGRFGKMSFSKDKFQAFPNSQSTAEGDLEVESDEEGTKASEGFDSLQGDRTTSSSVKPSRYDSTDPVMTPQRLDESNPTPASAQGSITSTS